jgi:penicillin amidase
MTLVAKFIAQALPRRCAGAIAATGLLWLAGGAPDAGAAAPGQVVIKRDGYGIPHIYASDTRALFHGYGYAVAEDRLYQMEMVKRSAEGTVAEVLGEQYLALDKATRADLDPASLRRQLAALPARERAVFEGYAAGFNARIRAVLANKEALLPKEFVDGGFEPSEWTAYDVAAVWVGLILNRFFSGNAELSNLNLLNALKAAHGAAQGEQMYRQLRWLDDPTAPTIQATGGSAASARAGKLGPLAGYLRPLTPAAALAYEAGQVERIGFAAAAGMPTASNAWVLAPAKTTSGRAVLYNGPQQGWFSPSIIYSVGLHGAGFDLTGSTPVGLPAVFFGTNGKIAWGSTVGGLDTNDLYQERLDAGNQYRYWFRGALRKMAMREETIRVRGAADVPYNVYSTVHGAVSGWDAEHHSAYVLKRSWAGHELESLLGWIYVGQAGSWDQFLAQAKRVAASITWFYADADGNIGYAGLGRLPRRPANQHIQFPANGDGSMEWQGTLPFSANPRQLNPAQGYLVSWNNKTMPGLAADGAEYSYVDRVNELSSQLAARPRLSDEEAWAVDRHAATADLNHRYFAPYLRWAVAGLPDNDPVRLAGMRAADWDGQLVDDGAGNYRDSAAVAIFHSWLRLMLQDLLGADLPREIYAKYAGTGYLPALSPLSAKPGAGVKQLWYALQQGREGAPLYFDFLRGRDPEQMIRAGLAAAVAELRATQGEDIEAWRSPMLPMQFAVESAVGVPWSTPGSAQIVTPYRNRGAVSLRISLGHDGVTMCSAAAPGQSGFIDRRGEADPHLTDQLPLFVNFACKQDWLTAPQVDAHAERTVRLAQ